MPTLTLDANGLVPQSQLPQVYRDMARDYCFTPIPGDSRTFKPCDLQTWIATAAADKTGLNSSGIVDGKATVTYGMMQGRKAVKLGTTAPAGKQANGFAHVELGGGVGLPDGGMAKGPKGLTTIIANIVDVDKDGNVSVLVEAPSNSGKSPDLALYIDNVLILKVMGMKSAPFTVSIDGLNRCVFQAWGDEIAKVELLIPVRSFDLTKTTEIDFTTYFLTPDKAQAVEMGPGLKMLSRVAFPNIQFVDGTLQLWNHIPTKWDPTGIAAPYKIGEWNKVQFRSSFDQGAYYYESVFLNDLPLLTKAHKPYPYSPPQLPGQESLAGPGLVSQYQRGYVGDLYMADQTLSVYNRNGGL